MEEKYCPWCKTKLPERLFDFSGKEDGKIITCPGLGCKNDLLILNGAVISSPDMYPHIKRIKGGNR
jgi:hypothetical protein